MRRTYISPEFDVQRINGTFNMKEESSFFGSKMLEIEDSLLIDNQNLVYFQSLSKEQLDLSIESTLPPISYSASDDKRVNHTFVIDESQSQIQRDTNTRYIVTIQLRDILTNYLFATLKRYRTFEGVRNIMTKNNDVDFAIKEYIVKNVLDRYKFIGVQFYINWVDIRNRSVLRYDNLWAGTSDTLDNRTAISPDIIGSETYRIKSIQTQTEFDDSQVIVTFNQEKKSSEYCFDYYFKLLYEKL